MPLWFAANGLLLVGAYLLGSLPSGYIAGKALKGIDIREHGSKSTGATNVLRTVGKGPAIAVLLADIFKGVLAILGARWVYSLPTFLALNPAIAPTWLPWVVVLAGMAALLGHSKSIWLNFTGGKSVATGLGVMLALDWQVGLGALATFGVVIGISRIVSLSSISAALAVGILMVTMGRPVPYQLLAIAGGFYVIWRHQTNIQRLLAGTEPKVGQKVPQEAEQVTTSE